jgi:hypothetical protein
VRDECVSVCGHYALGGALFVCVGAALANLAALRALRATPARAGHRAAALRARPAVPSREKKLSRSRNVEKPREPQ